MVPFTKFWLTLVSSVLVFIMSCLFCYADDTLVIENPIAELTIAYFQPDTSANPVEANIALQYWGDMVGKQIGKKVKTRFFVDIRNFNAFLDANPIELAIVNPVFILENHKKRHLVPVVIGVQNGKTHYERVLIVAEESEVTSIDELREATLVTTQLGEQTSDFVEKIEFGGAFSIKTTFPTIILKENPRRCLNALLEKSADVAMIPKANYEILKDLNPAFNKTRILMTARKIPIAAGVYFADSITLEEVQPFIDAALSLHTNPKGQQSLMIFNIEKLVPCSIEPFLELESVLSQDQQ